MNINDLDGYGAVILSAAKNLRPCEMRSGAVKVTEKKWLDKPQDTSFHTVSLTRRTEILRCAQNDSPDFD